MSFEEKFNAAVAVIHTLPKEGPMNPSDGTKLKFYGLYKQAKEGKNDKSQPWAVQLEARAKWDAWNKLGDMSKEQAMKQYADEIYKMFADTTDEDLQKADANLRGKIQAFLALMKK